MDRLFCGRNTRDPLRPQVHYRGRDRGRAGPRPAWVRGHCKSSELSGASACRKQYARRPEKSTHIGIILHAARLPRCALPRAQSATAWLQPLPGLRTGLTRPSAPSADLPVGENLRTRPLPHLPLPCGIGAIGCRGACWARNPITSTATAVRPPLDHEDQGDVSLPISASIWTFPGAARHGRLQSPSGGTPGWRAKSLVGVGFWRLGGDRKKVPVKRRLGLQFVAAYPRLCSTAPLTPI